MDSRNFDKIINCYSIFCKIGYSWEKELKKNGFVIAMTSEKNIVVNPTTGIVSYILLYLLLDNFSTRISLKRPSSFFRSRTKYFWGYKTSFCAKNTKRGFINSFTQNILSKAVYFGFSKKKEGFFFGRKKTFSLRKINILDEFSETSFFKLKNTPKVSFLFYSKNKNYINSIPWHI